MTLKSLSLSLFTCALLLASVTVRANDEDPQEQLTRAAATENSSGWIFGAGLAFTNPGYVGYDHQVTPLPLVFYHNGRFFFAGLGAGYVLAGDSHVRLSLLVRPEINRLRASDSPQLTGIQTREWSIDGGVNLDVFEAWGNFNAGLFHDLLDRNNGMQAAVGYKYPLHLGSWTLAPGLGLSWDNGNFTNYYYGVSQAEAIPGRPAYDPGSATNPYVSLGLSTSISDDWQFRSEVRYMRFGSVIHDSPIVDRSGSPTVFIGFIYNPDKESRHDAP